MDYVDLNTVIHFTNCNSHGDYNSVGRYYLNKTDNEVYDSEKVSAEMSISKNEFKDNCWYYGYIPLPKFNISDVIGDFIASLNNKKFTEYFKDFDREDIQNFWIEFDNFFMSALKEDSGMISMTNIYAIQLITGAKNTTYAVNKI